MALTTVPASLSATALTLTTAAQPNITSVGTLTGLTVSGNIAGTLTTAAQTNITSLGTLSALTVSGTLTGSDILLNDSGNNERSLRIQNSTVTSYLGVEGSSANRFVGSAANNMFLGTTTADGIEFATNNTVRAVIDSSGNFGIGVSPAAPLDVMVAGANQWYIRNSDSSAQNNAIVSLRSGGYSNIALDGATVDLKIGGSSKLHVDQYGKIGYWCYSAGT